MIPIYLAEKRSGISSCDSPVWPARVFISLVAFLPFAVSRGTLLGHDLKLYLIRMTVMVLAGWLGLEFVRKGRLPVPPWRVLIPAVGFCLYSAGSVLFLPHADGLIAGDIAVAVAFFLLALVLLHEPVFRDRVLVAWQTGVVPVCAYYLLQRAGIPGFQWHNPGHNLPGGLFGNMNFLSFFLVCSFPFSISLIHGKSIWRKALAISNILVIAGTLFYSSNRSGPAILLMTLPVYVWHYGNRLASWKWRFMARGVYLALGAALVVAAGLAATAFLTLDFGSLDDIFHGRLGIWRDSLPMLRDGFWFGHGPGAFRRVFPSYRTEALGYFFEIWAPVFHSHSMVLEAFLESGLVGVVLLGWLFYEGSGRFIGLTRREEDGGRERFFAGMALVSIGLFSLVHEITHFLFCTIYGWLVLAFFYNETGGRLMNITLGPRIRGVSFGGLTVLVLTLFMGMRVTTLDFLANRHLQKAVPFLANPSRFRQAEVEIEKALRFRPKNIHGRYQRAYLAMSQGNLPKALEEYNFIRETEPYFENLHYNLGIVYFRSGYWAAAAENLTVTVRLYPTFGDGILLLALVELYRGNAGAALEWCAQLARIGAFGPKALEIKRAAAALLAGG